ncbi:uncharacterized protein N7518_009210 [Penicillium psychrosexuale]|uniref:uncharacterized protein n=1 Tax=Penicillium psychrosexuale TaxID=1002107 RepID=UPI002545412E|nr:uncharacterized protein N7518_009210 [Penicillium psychrosexuale]KAJ5783533.1 hypothetical protein N7518_009210 [Penicillium psychrosexuale]
MKFYDAPNIDIANVEFVEMIKQTDRSFLCRARWEDKDCLLKMLKKFYDETFPEGLDSEGLDRKARPNGVLIEYIPDLNMIDISNYTEQRAQKLKQLLAEIHKAGIVHLDPYPRNMLIQGDSDRVLWIDFELSQIYDPEHLEHPRYFTFEREDMDRFIQKLVILSVLV